LKNYSAVLQNNMDTNWLIIVWNFTVSRLAEKNRVIDIGFFAGAKCM